MSIINGYLKSVFLQDSTANYIDQIIIATISALAPIVFVSCFKHNASYGKHASKEVKLTLPGKLAFSIQESPSVIMYLLTFIRNSNDHVGMFQYLQMMLYLFHYVHRSFYYPWVRAVSMNDSSVVEVFLPALVFCSLNGYVNAKYTIHSADDPHGNIVLSIIGVVLFAVGFYINYVSDETLFQLRRSRSNSNSEKYQIPRGGMFEYVSSANYFGEIVEWMGWALFTGHAAGVTFAIFTAANLIPRGVANHEWYKKQFGKSYPPERKAIIPFLW
jgi:protein-S-isoprenylcysteine O-methyltransferase Ste14